MDRASEATKIFEQMEQMVAFGLRDHFAIILLHRLQKAIDRLGQEGRVYSYAFLNAFVAAELTMLLIMCTVVRVSL